MAQDKKGLDVDDDSLISLAYAYYQKRPDDSLYAKCMYYTGLYYMLNDYTEEATDCFNKAIRGAKANNESYTLFLALNRKSRLSLNTNPKQAVSLEREALKVYRTISNAPKANAVYLLLDLANAQMVNNDLAEAEKECRKALSIAKELGDSIEIAAAYQNMAAILIEREDTGEALEFSKKAYDFSNTKDNSQLLNLAWAYLDADSTDSCLRLVHNITPGNFTEAYTLNYLLYKAAMKEDNYNNAAIYGDSAYQYLENMYSEELNKKNQYYESWTKAQYDKGLAAGQSEAKTLVIITILVSSLVIISLLVYSLRQKREKARAMMKAEKEKHELQLHLIANEVKKKESQLEVMRAFIFKKIDTAQTLQEIKKGGKNIKLSESDWDDILMFVDSLEERFVSRLRAAFPKLNEEDVRFFTLVRVDIPARALAQIYNITEKSIKQKLFLYKSKVGISRGDESLRRFIKSF